MEVARGWGWGIGNQCSVGTEFQIYKMERALEMDGGDSCTTVCM